MFRKAFKWKILVYFMAIWKILLPIGIFFLVWVVERKKSTNEIQPILK
jgi:hypothetical protein